MDGSLLLVYKQATDMTRTDLLDSIGQYQHKHGPSEFTCALWQLYDDLFANENAIHWDW